MSKEFLLCQRMAPDSETIAQRLRKFKYCPEQTSSVLKKYDILIKEQMGRESSDKHF